LHMPAPSLVHSALWAYYQLRQSPPWAGRYGAFALKELSHNSYSYPHILLVLHMPALLAVHSVFWTCSAYELRAQAVTCRCGAFASCCVSFALRIPSRLLVVHSACWICLLAQVTTAVRGLVRLSCYLLYASFIWRMPALWPVQSAHAGSAY